MICKFFLTIILLLVIPFPASAKQIICAGVLGNSGEQGRTLVHFKDTFAPAIGVAYDQYGTLWSKAGKGLLNRYALDGRLLAQYQIPTKEGRSDKLTIIGEHLFLLAQNKLFSLDVTGNSDQKFSDLQIEAAQISFGNSGGRLLCLGLDQQLFWLNAQTKEKVSAGINTQNVERIFNIETAPDATIYYQDEHHNIYAAKAGANLLPGWPKNCQGDYPQLIDSNWYLQRGSSTVFRTNNSMLADPGVVLGGKSGSFLGYLPANSEIELGTGMAKISNDIYSICGHSGILHLLRWHNDKKQFEILHRLGALRSVTSLTLSPEAKIWCNSGVWNWSDSPLAALQNCSSAQEDAGQAMVIANDILVVPVTAANTTKLLSKSLTGSGKSLHLDINLRTPVIGLIEQKLNNEESTVWTATESGECQSFRISSSGKPLSTPQDCKLLVSGKTNNWTSLSLLDDKTLIAGADGAVIELKMSAADWKESSRWNSWGTLADQHFGKKIYTAYSAGILWVSDSQRHRILAFDPKTHNLLAAFGKVDLPGNDLSSLNFPEIIAAHNDKAIVFDSRNQRLTKLQIIK